MCGVLSRFADTGFSLNLLSSRTGWSAKFVMDGFVTSARDASLNLPQHGCHSIVAPCPLWADRPISNREKISNPLNFHISRFGVIVSNTVATRLLRRAACARVCRCLLRRRSLSRVWCFFFLFLPSYPPALFPILPPFLPKRRGGGLSWPPTRTFSKKRLLQLFDVSTKWRSNRSNVVLTF